MIIVMIDDISQCRKATIVIKAVFAVTPKAFEWCRTVSFVWATIGLKTINTDFFSSVHVPARLSEKWWHVAARAICALVENGFTALGCGRVKYPSRWSRRFD